MTPQERIEEAHGLWELAVQRVLAISETVAMVIEIRPGDQLSALLRDAIRLERSAFALWRQVSEAALSDGDVAR